MVLTFLDILFKAFSFAFSLWWLFTPLILFLFAWHLWIKYRRGEYIRNMDWVLLEVKPPRDIEKTPLSMEQANRSLSQVLKYDREEESHGQRLIPAPPQKVRSAVHRLGKCMKRKMN